MERGISYCELESKLIKGRLYRGLNKEYQEGYNGDTRSLDYGSYNPATILEFEVLSHRFMPY